MIELMVVVSVIAIMATIAAPSIRSMLEANAISNEINNFVGTLQMARSEAIKNAADVVMCKASPNSSGVFKCKTGSEDWNIGWVVFVDRDGDADLDTSNDQIISVSESISRTGAIVKNNNRKIIFNRLGLVADGFSQFTFNSKSGDNNLQKRVCLSKSGRVRVIADPNEVCDG